MPNWARKLAQQAKAEPRKAAALAVLAFVMVMLLGRAMLRGGPAPARAAARPSARSAVTNAISGIAGLTQTVSSSAVNPGVALAEWLRKPLGPAPRNLFVIKIDYFPQDSRQATPLVPAGDGFWDQLAKSMVARADQEKARRHLVENLRLQASKLELESTMVSHGAPKALINGNLVGEGEVVAEFRVLKIEARRIILEREGIKFEIRR